MTRYILPLAATFSLTTSTVPIAAAQDNVTPRKTESVQVQAHDNTGPKADLSPLNDIAIEGDWTALSKTDLQRLKPLQPMQFDARNSDLAVITHAPAFDDGTTLDLGVIRDPNKPERAESPGYPKTQYVPPARVDAGVSLSVEY